MNKKVSGSFTNINGNEVYKIENYDCMENFFMTITSSSDIWNFCWSQGGITAGRIDSNHAVFPYYTSDKVHDAGSYTGAYTCIKVISSNDEIYWEPFSSFYYPPMKRMEEEKKLIHNIYKNFTGTQVWFEEINTELQMLFRTGWTSSEKFGLVRTSYIENLSDKKRKVIVLDGCQNIMPACCTSDFQNEKSNLLDAYKKTDLEENTNIAYFSLSSVVSDKAEPNESLYANTCWFSTDDKIILSGDGKIRIAKMIVHYMSMPGHTSDSVVYGIGNILFTGDVISAGAIGSTNSSYSDYILKSNIQEKIYSQQDGTVLMPGHGPPTTLGAVKAFNKDFDKMPRL